jgi:hypothetical protein
MDKIEQDYQALFDGKVPIRAFNEAYPFSVKRTDVDEVRYAKIIGKMWLWVKQHMDGEKPMTGDQFLDMLGQYLNQKRFYGEIL